MSQPAYCDSEAKFKARSESVISRCIDIGIQIRQWWTLGGDMTSNGRIGPTSELAHVVSSGLIRPHQFHSPDRDASVVRRNINAVRGSEYDGANFYVGDFSDCLADASSSRLFDPSVINLDTTSSPRYGRGLLIRVLDICGPYKSPCLLFWNSIVAMSYPPREYSHALRSVLDDPEFRYFLDAGGWRNIDSKPYLYAGTGKSAYMATLAFSRGINAST